MSSVGECVNRKKVTFSNSDNQGRNTVPIATTHNQVDKSSTDRKLPYKQVIKTKHLQPKVSEKNEVKKMLIRNTETALPLHKMVKEIPGVSESIITPKTYNTKGGSGNVTSKSNYISRYATPELYSTLCIAKEIHKVSKQRNKTKSNALVMDGVSGRKLEDKVKNKLNFPLEEQLYKDLVALNVSDEVVQESGEERRSCKKMMKDKEPNLSDFYMPSFGQEYSVISEPLYTTADKIPKYNGFYLYKRKQIWEVLDNMS